MSTQVEIDVFNLKGTIDGLKWLYNNIDDEIGKMLKDIADTGEDYLKKEYSSKSFDPNIKDISTTTRNTKNTAEIIASGKDVLYEEFGTGDEGQSNPHPVKSKYNLNDYNSGEYIRNVSDIPEDSYTMEDLKAIGITSGNFWRYKDGDILRYTQGVPSGQEMWNTRNYLLDGKIMDIVNERGKIINENITKSIKK